MFAPWKRIRKPRGTRPRYGNLIDSIRERLIREPRDLRLRHSLAVQLGRAGRYREAILEAEKLLDLEPSHVQGKRLLLGLRFHRFLRGDSAA